MYASQVLKIENDCVHHPRNFVTLDVSVALDKFDRKRKKEKEKKNNTSSKIFMKRGNDCKISRLFITFESLFEIDIVKFQRVPILPCNVARICRKSEKHFYFVAAIPLITLQTF